MSLKITYIWEPVCHCYSVESITDVAIQYGLSYNIKWKNFFLQIFCAVSKEKAGEWNSIREPETDRYTDKM